MKKESTHDHLLFIIVIVAAAGLFSSFLIVQQGAHNRAGVAYTALSQVPQGYAPPWNPFTNVAMLTLNVSTNGTDVFLNVSADGMLFYKTFYVYDKSVTGKWKAYTFDETPDYENAWIDGHASASLILDANTLDPESWVLVYGCARQDGVWKCGCYSSADTQCRKWSIQNFELNLCSDDPACDGRDDAYCDGDTLITCTAGTDGCLDAEMEDCAASGQHCITSGTSVSCADCAEEPPAASTVDCGSTSTGTLCNGTDYSVDGTKCSGNKQCVSGTCVECVQNSDCTSGHCVSNTCVECEAASDCANPPSGYDNECYTTTCNDGTCAYATTSRDGTSCTTSSGDAGTCQGGACVTGCTPECDPATYNPVCRVDPSPPWAIHYETCGDANGDGCPEIISTDCTAEQYCDPSMGGCYDPSCGDGIKQWEEECDEGASNGPCPATCSDSCTLNNCDGGAECGNGICDEGEDETTCPDDCVTTVDGDTSETDCNAASDQTDDSYPSDPNRGDQGKAWLDPWPSSAHGTPNCCGDDANEYLIYKQGDNTKQSCCASDAECLDDYGACYANDATTHFTSGDYYCLENWWYGCKTDDDICRIHKDNSLSGSKDCYYSNGNYVWGDYNSPPQEECGDGKDNDCDGKVDDEDGDCPAEVDIFLHSAFVKHQQNIISISVCSEPEDTDASHAGRVIFSSTGKNQKITREFMEAPSTGEINYLLHPCSVNRRFFSLYNLQIPDYVTLETQLDYQNEVAETNEQNNNDIFVYALGDITDQACGGRGEWPCDDNNHGKWCGGQDATACGVTCDAGLVFCPDTNGCWNSCS